MATPTKTLLQGAEYTPACKTDIRKRFEAMRVEQSKKQDKKDFKARLAYVKGGAK